MRALHKCPSSDNVKIDVHSLREDDKNVKVREYLNSAVYVETTYDMPHGKSMYMNIPGSGDHPKVVKVKRCLCFTNPKDCPCHPYNDDPLIDEQKFPRFSKSTFALSTPSLPTNPHFSTHQIETPNFESDSGITVKATNSTTDDLHLSIPSLTTLNTVRGFDDLNKEESFKSWCMKKDQERKLQEQKNALMEEIKKKQREQQIELERENFKRWLANKKREEELKKRQLEQKLQEERIQNEMKEKRMQENHLSFQLWAKRKEEMILEKKIKEQMKLIKQEEERQRRLAYSAQAYDIWLQQSKNKPKPLPLSRGLETLKSSVSVTYINPEPWVPNIDVTQKPTSQ